MTSIHASTSTDTSHGLFITFEGGEGSGKSTQVMRLFNRLKPILIAHGSDIILTREPGGSQGAEDIRSILVSGEGHRWSASTEALLMFAARDDHWSKTISPALSKGNWVICDRFADSSFAYQGYGKGVSFSLLDNLYEQTIGSAKPDRTYLLDVPTDIGLSRAEKRLQMTPSRSGIGGEDRFESLGYAFHKSVRDGFLRIAANEPQRFYVVDATLSLDEVESHIWQDLTKWLRNRGINWCLT